MTCKNWPPMWRLTDLPAVRKQAAEGARAACSALAADMPEIAAELYRATAGLELLAMLIESGEIVSGGYLAALDKEHGFAVLPDSNAFAPAHGARLIADGRALIEGDRPALPALTSRAAMIDKAFAEARARSRIAEITDRLNEITEEIDGIAESGMSGEKWLALIEEVHRLTAEGFALGEKIEAGTLGDDDDEDGEGGPTGAPAVPEFAGDLVISLRKPGADPEVLQTIDLANLPPPGRGRCELRIDIERAV